MTVVVRCLCAVAALVLAAADANGQRPDDAVGRWQSQFLQGGELVLTQEYGRAVYDRCVFTVVYLLPPLPGTDRMELRCRPNVSPPVGDIFSSRMLSADEVNVIAKAANASDLYAGGHAGNFALAAGSEGPFERLEVGHCCGNGDRVVLIVTGNPTFANGNRRALLDLLAKWRDLLMTEVRNQRPR